MINPPCSKSSLEFATIRGDKKEIAMAKAICATCPWTEECLASARPGPGVYGGLSPRERQRSGIRGPVPGDKPIDHGSMAGYRRCLMRPEGSCTACKAANTQKWLRATHEHSH